MDCNGSDLVFNTKSSTNEIIQATTANGNYLLEESKNAEKNAPLSEFSGEDEVTQIDESRAENVQDPTNSTEVVDAVEESKVAEPNDSTSPLDEVEASTKEKEDTKPVEHTKEMATEDFANEIAKSQLSKRKKFTIIDSDSDESENETTAMLSGNKNMSDEEHDEESKSNYKPTNSRKIIDSESENEEEAQKVTDENAKKSTSKPKFSALIDSDSESGTQSDDKTETDNEPLMPIASDEENDEVGSGTQATETQGKMEKTVRAAAKKALDGMQAIQSEQQRLHREAHISIPYHKPKRHTLQEFLKRRTIIKPSLKESGNKAAAVVQSRKLKMTPEELAEYAKLLDERAKEAKEFFKSESDDDGDTQNKANLMSAGITGTTTTAEECIKQAMETETTSEVEPLNEDDDDFSKLTDRELEAITLGLEIDFANPLKDDTQDKPKECNEIQDVEENNTVTPDVLPCSEVTLLPSQPIITEVLELPRLNIKDLSANIDEDMLDTISSPTPVPAPTLTPAQKTENLKRLLGEEVMLESPSLQGDANMLIDLESGDLIPKKPSGVDNLLKRFLSMQKAKKVKDAETLSIISTENGKLEISQVEIHLNDEKEMNKDPKPGAAFIKCQETLKSIIAKKRHEKLQKKREDLDEYNMILDLDGDEEDYEEYEPGEKYKEKMKPKDIVVDEDENAYEVEDDEEGEDLEDDEEDEDADAAENIKDTEEVKEEQELKDENADDDDDEDDEESDDESDDESEDDAYAETINTAETKKKSRIIKPFQDDSDNEADMLPPATISTTTTTPIATTTLFDKKIDEKSHSDIENELLGLCSGAFTQTPNPTPMQSAKQDDNSELQQTSLISQIPITQRNGNKDDTEELLGLCSGTFDQITQAADATQTQLSIEDQQKVNMVVKSNKILSSDEDVAVEIEDAENNKNSCNRKKKLTKKRKKKTVKLGFSDDEEDSVEEACSGNEELEPEDELETFIDYDSEENEVVVQMTKKECKKQAQNFFEKEAELSESEWGSADEDEKNLDNYDIELGDEDEFDREKLQTELGQIHARKVLDEDIREVRKLQEMFFEDEENDGVGRQRQFRWKNAESGFSLDDNDRANCIEGGEQGESGDEENEQMWRKIRFEREQLLKEQGLKNSQDLTTTFAQSFIETSSVTLTPGGLKKFNIITAKKTTTSVDIKKNSPFLITNSLAAGANTKSRGSFLVRDKETLVKIAGITKGSGSANNFEESHGMVPVKRVKTTTTNNFVFSVLTEEEHESIKRKADDLINSSNENGTNYMKKPKLAPKREKCFIDQLMH